MKAAALMVLALALASAGRAQQAEALSPWQEPVLQLPGNGASPPPRLPVDTAERKGPVATLYRALRSASLNPARVFHVREAVLDRGELHLYLTDGTIGFTEDVAGRVTGAFFQGEGEVLMRPPDLTEHASLGLFSGFGVLDEHFSAAYLRFNDDLMSELKPFLRESEEQQGFLQSYDEQARGLAGMDALHLLGSFTEEPSLAAADHFLHARLATRLGSLDVYDDSQAEDQFKVARLSQPDATPYFDVWMAFPGREAREMGERRVVEPMSSAWAVPVESFRIDTKLAPPEMLEATAELDVAVKDGGQKLLSFELSRWLQVSTVEVDGAEMEFLQNDALNGSELARIGNDLVTVVMPMALRAGEHHRLRFHYAGPGTAVCRRQRHVVSEPRRADEPLQSEVPLAQGLDAGGDGAARLAARRRRDTRGRVELGGEDSLGGLQPGQVFSRRGKDERNRGRELLGRSGGAIASQGLSGVGE